MANTADSALYGELTSDVGAWSGALGGPGPGANQIAEWVKQYGQQNQFGIETANIGWWAQQHHLSGNRAQILANAQKDPRWNQVDARGQQMLLEMYNLQAMGYGGNLGQYTPLPAQTPGPGGDTGIGNAPNTGMSSSQQSGWAILQQLLASYGFTGQDLTDLTAWAKQQIMAGNSADLITLELQQTPQFQKRFPAIGQLSAKGVAITPAQYISLEQSYASLEQAAGLPANFASYDQLIAMEVSPSEYSDRITNGYLAVAQADPTVIQAMQDFYGVTNGQLAAYFLDPTKAEPLLKQQAISAQIGGAAAQAAFNRPAGTTEGISQAQALRLAQMGVTQPQAQQGFRQLSQEQQLYQPLPGGGQIGNPLTSDQLLNAQFGADGQTELQLQLQAQYEKGTTSQGTQVGQTQQGAVGAGAVQR